VVRRVLSLLLVLGLSVGSSPSFAQVTDLEVVKGIKQVEDGDYDGAILTLDNAARRLATDPNKFRDLSQAYLYLGISYAGKGHEAAAKAKFREALGQTKDLSLSPEKFPPKVINLFEAAKQERNQASAPEAAKKGGGGSHKGLFIGLGVAAAAGVGIA
jgi:tetratricopeptide (TPR) repeat protein